MKEIWRRYKMKFTNNKIMAALGSLTAGIGCMATFFGVKLYNTNKKMDQVIKNTNSAKKHVYELTDVEIADSIVQDAVAEKVNRVVTIKTNKATNEIIDDFKMDIARNVKEAVEREASLNKKLVKKKIEEEVEKISVDEFKRDAIDKAEKMLLEKTEKDADEILKKYFKRLDRETDMYETFLQKISNKNKNLEEISKMMED